MSNKILALIDFETQTIKAVDIEKRCFVGEYGFNSQAAVTQEIIDEVLAVDYSIPFEE